MHAMHTRYCLKIDQMLHVRLVVGAAGALTHGIPKDCPIHRHSDILCTPCWRSWNIGAILRRKEGLARPAEVEPRTPAAYGAVPPAVVGPRNRQQKQPQFQARRTRDHSHLQSSRFSVQRAEPASQTSNHGENGPQWRRGGTRRPARRPATCGRRASAADPRCVVRPAAGAVRRRRLCRQ